MYHGCYYLSCEKGGRGGGGQEGATSYLLYFLLPIPTPFDRGSCLFVLFLLHNVAKLFSVSPASNHFGNPLSHYLLTPASHTPPAQHSP